MDIFRDPVITPSGISYERAVLMEHFRRVRVPSKSNPSDVMDVDAMIWCYYKYALVGVVCVGGVTSFRVRLEREQDFFLGIFLIFLEALGELVDFDFD